MDAAEPDSSDASRAKRLERHRGWKRRLLITTTVIVVAGGGAVAAYAFAWKPSSTAARADIAAAADPTTKPTVTSTTKPLVTTTTTTVPPVKQPGDTAMPPPGNGLRYGSRGPLVLQYEARMKQLHFDPGPIDGVFDQDTQYAVIAVQKYFGQPRTGVINTGVQLVLSHFRYSPSMPTSEANRVEIDLDRQVLTAFQAGQPILITTTSTGSGEHFCGGEDGCQYAITPAGHYHFYEFDRGWKKGKLGQMWNPYFFNGGIAVHGLQSVPTHPASHGCARIPMHIADYFHTLVTNGESVFVVGTPMARGGGYVGPYTPPTTVPPTVPPVAPPVTPPPTSPPTTKRPAPTTTAPVATTTTPTT